MYLQKDIRIQINQRCTFHFEDSAMHQSKWIVAVINGEDRNVYQMWKGFVSSEHILNTNISLL